MSHTAKGVMRFEGRWLESERVGTRCRGRGPVLLLPSGAPPMPALAAFRTVETGSVLFTTDVRTAAQDQGVWDHHVFRSCILKQICAQAMRQFPPESPNQCVHPEIPTAHVPSLYGNPRPLRSGSVCASCRPHGMTGVTLCLRNLKPRMGPQVLVCCDQTHADITVPTVLRPIQRAEKNALKSLTPVFLLCFGPIVAE